MNPEDAKKVLDTFLAALAADEDTVVIAAGVAPYRSMLGDDCNAVAALDKLAEMWEGAKMAVEKGVIS